ncbi:prephenate dehydratase domain-containing protein [Xanthovirga aplysinae]|uniref:prephenate dehydratase domain-containing protein n=1 Tax=Xanthovirga aplysinae TaxID=2529853 RepID=UPI0012BBF804|nr:prephenate dehydratase domain-containing protein [Xanthovirga aplysinae]MTI33334.1 hypothetical protein [Xanthovirga aplysinae]
MINKPVAIFGIEGSFHHLAAQKYFGNDIKVHCMESFQTLIETCSKSDEAPYGIIAIENSLAGDVNNNCSRVKTANLDIVAEVNLEVNHHLMALMGQDVNEIKEIRSHPTAINQCKNFLNQFNNISIIKTGNTAGNAQLISEKKLKNVAVIGSEYAANLYGLQILKKRIQDTNDNITKFLVIAKKEKKLNSITKARYW